MVEVDLDLALDTLAGEVVGLVEKEPNAVTMGLLSRGIGGADCKVLVSIGGTIVIGLSVFGTRSNQERFLLHETAEASGPPFP